MSDRAKSLLSLLASLAVGGGLLWLALRDADLGAVADALAQGEWVWIVPFVLAGVASVVVRAWRWGLLIDALPSREAPVPLTLTTASVAIGYLVNYAAPRLGEVARAANVSRQADAPFSAVFGTVVAERVLDVVALALALGSVVVLFGDRVGAVLGQATDRLSQAVAETPGWAVGLGLAVAVALAVGAAWLVRHSSGRLGELLASFRDGLASVGRTGRPGTVLLSTALLWASYALMADLPLRLLGMDDAFGLGLADAWAVMAIGGIGMALPSPGGTGSFHYATVQALTLLFAVAVTPAATYALLVHATGIVFYCVFGVGALAAQGTSLGALTARARAESA